MESHDTPYEYAGEVPDGGLQDEPRIAEDETVIVDGAAMTYRRYRRAAREEE